jgi:hypothetical protein
VPYVPNINKVVFLNVGTVPWRQALAPKDSNPDDYFAPGLNLYLEQDIQFSASNEYSNPFKELLAKFKDSTVGKLASGLKGAIDAYNGIVEVIGSSPTTSGGNKYNPDGSPATPGPNVSATGKANAAYYRATRVGVFAPNVRYQTKLSNIPAWNGTSPVRLSSFTFRFYMGMAEAWDGRTEVYNPTVALYSMCLPSGGAGFLRGPLPSTAYIYGSIGAAMAGAVSSQFNESAANSGMFYPVKYTPGDKSDWRESDKAVRETKAEQIAYNFEKTITGMVDKFEKSLFSMISGWGGLISLGVGRFTFPAMIVKDTSMRFSRDTDENGFPIWGEVTWSGCEAIMVATKGDFKLFDRDSVEKVMGGDDATESESAMNSWQKNYDEANKPSSKKT